MHNSPSALATVGFVGAGRTGSALALNLAQAGYPVVAVASRSAASAHRLAARIGGCTPLPDAQAVAGTAELVFVTTPDDVIAQVVSGVSWHSGQGVVHCSGALGLEPLAPAAAQMKELQASQGYSTSSSSLEFDRVPLFC